MEADNTSTFLLWLVYIGLAAVVFVIVWNIIASATKAKSILKLQRMQVELLEEIALKHGVDPERVKQIIKFHNKDE